MEKQLQPNYQDFKFRAWISRGRGFIYFVFMDIHYVYEGKEVIYLVRAGLQNFILKHLHIDQWTGYKDKNGQDIYVGDKLVDDFGFSFALLNHSHVPIMNFNECKIVGDVYQEAK